MENQNRKVPLITSVALMIICAVAGWTGSCNPIMEKLIQAFPEYSTATVRMLATLPNLITLITMLIVGMLAGRQFSYKTVCVIGAVTYLIGGIGPMFFSTNLTVMLAFRGVLGFGIGCWGVRNAMIIRIYSPDEAANVMGKGMMVLTLAAAVYQPICGAISESVWSRAFLVHLIGIAALVMVFVGLNQPEFTLTATEIEKPEEKKERASFNPKILLYAFICLVNILLLFPLLTGTATHLEARGLGGTTISGLVLSCYTIGGAVTSYFFGKMMSRFGRFTIPVGYVLIAIGQALMFVNNIYVIALGIALCGAGFFPVYSSLVTYAGRAASQAGVAFATTLVMGFGDGGAYLSSYWILLANFMLKNFFATDIERAFFVAAVACVILAILTAVFNIQPGSAKAAKDNVENSI